jgi:hypothetical protein
LRLDNGDGDPFANVDYIMRFENLADDFRAVCTAIGISPPTLPQYNRSSRDHYSKYYDDELRELVRARFQCGDRAVWVHVRTEMNTKFAMRIQRRG